jgi:hypothetical protein
VDRFVLFLSLEEMLSDFPHLVSRTLAVGLLYVAFVLLSSVTQYAEIRINKF